MVSSQGLENEKLRVASRSFAKLSPPSGIALLALPGWVDELDTSPQLAIHRSGDPFTPGLVIDNPDPLRQRLAWQSLGTGPGDAFEDFTP